MKTLKFYLTVVATCFLLMSFKVDKKSPTTEQNCEEYATNAANEEYEWFNGGLLPNWNYWQNSYNHYLAYCQNYSAAGYTVLEPVFID